jgi:hypothetical protein
MKSMSISSGTAGFGDSNDINTQRIYVIIRVFNLGKDNMGMRIYVDPEAMRRTGQLEFTAESWSVIPGKSETGNALGKA